MKTMFSLACAALLAASVLPASAQTISPLRRPAQSAPAPATAPAPAQAAPAPTMATPDKPAPSKAQLAQRNRMKQCGAEWQGMKKAGKTKGKTWREFSSECLSKN